LKFFAVPTILTRTVVYVLGIVVTFISLEATREYAAHEDTLERAQFDVNNMAITLRNHTSDAIQVTEVLLTSIAERLLGASSPQDALSIVESLNQVHGDSAIQSSDIAIIAKDGSWITAPLPVAGAQTDGARLALFHHHLQSDELEVYFGRPLKRTSDGEWLLTISRRVNASDGSFDGVVVATLTARSTASFFQNFIRAARDRVTLISSTGRIITEAPYDPERIDSRFSIPADAAPLTVAANVTARRYVAADTGEAFLVGVDGDPHHGFSLVVAAAESDLLAPWYNGMLQRAGANVLFVLLVLVLGYGLLYQIRKRREGELLLTQREADFRLLAENGTDIVERYSGEGIRLYVSPAAEQIIGHSPAELLGSRALDSLPEDMRPLAREAAQRLRRGETATETLTYRMRHKQGHEIWLESSFRAVAGPDGTLSDLVVTTRDITARKQLELRLEAIATLDGLTGLRNRRTFDAALAVEVERSHRTGRPLSLLMIDVDRFKLYNDEYGHVAGDACLRSIASVIAMAARRPGDMAARYGGEEMVVLLPDANSAAATFMAGELCRQLQALSIPHLHNVPWQVATASIGVSTLENRPGDPRHDGQWLVSTADMALYQAKHEGRNRAKVAPPPMPNFEREAG